MTVVVEYIWIDADQNTRSKARTLTDFIEVKFILDLPEWNFDGSSTRQMASGIDSEVILKPIALFTDPFRQTFPCLTYLALCDCYDRKGKAINSNFRIFAFRIFDTPQVKSQETWFGLEQEYIILKNKGRLLGWPLEHEPEPQGKYYCGVGSDRTFGREIVEEHYKMCLIAGIKISGINEEVLPGQWEFQVGPCEGIDAADQLWVARYILHRICEKHDVLVSFAPKPVKGDWNGSGLHTNFSTLDTRAENGIDKIYSAIDKLSVKHLDHLKVYGDNSERLSGKHETSNPEIFTWGVADRTASIRIPSQVEKDKSGYLEDRRVASDADPYLVTSIIAKTVLL